MSRRRRGEPVDRSEWPEDGPARDWLAFCDRLRTDNGMPGLRAIAQGMHLASPTRVGDLLRGRKLPMNGAQARALLEALGAVGGEIDRGMAPYGKAVRGRTGVAPRPSWWLRSAYREQVLRIAP